ncbi:MAG: hypothetical protein P1U36_07085 [Legionellaceae bacterium]|nr:hypothetical protein [Legionellaceae bacterium]
MGELDQLQQGYRDNIDALRAASDAEFGIVSKRVPGRDGAPDTWERDATQAFALDDPQRPPHDAAMIEANNTLLRMLARLRPIDYMLSKHENNFLDEDTRQVLRNKLNIMFEENKTAILALARSNDLPLEKNERITKAMHKIEKAFSTVLINSLHEANLTKGCSTQHDAEALLAHYKILYSVLDPAMPLVTLTYDKDEGILQRETQYPVTEKTEFQKGYAGVLKNVNPYPLEGEVESEVNAHTVHNEAKQQADKCFADLIVADDRMLTSQARKSHVVGVKNAFIVKVETQRCEYGFDLERDKEQLDDKDPLWLGRMGVPVYVGSGEKDTKTHVKENFEQLEMAAKKYMKHEGELNIHLTTLNTDTSIDGEKQDVMIAGIREAMEGPKYEVSVVPTNDMGMLYTPQVADVIQQEGKAQPGQKADRLDLAVDVVLKAEDRANTISFVNCASGIDRTGTVIEAAIQRHIVAKLEVDKSAVENMRARGFNSAEMTHHMVPGTPGMKPCSKANNWFGWGRKTFNDLAEREFYLKSALLNKKNKIKNVDCFDTPSALLKAELEKHEEKLEEKLEALLVSMRASENSDNLRTDMIKAAEQVLNKAKHRFAFKTKDYEQVSAIYVLVTHVLEQTNKENLAEEELHEIDLSLKRINSIMEELPNAQSLKKKIQNFVLTAVVTLAAAVLLSVPWFNAIFFVSSLLVVLSSVKVGGVVGAYGALAKKAFIFSLPGSKDFILDSTVRDKTKAFTQAGQTFFDKHQKKLQDEPKSNKPESGSDSDPDLKRDVNHLD